MRRGGMQDPLIDLAATSVAVDQVFGNVLVGMHGVDLLTDIGGTPGAWGDGFLFFEYNTPWNGGDDSVSLLGFQNSAGNIGEARPFLNRTYTHSNAFHDLDASSDGCPECGDELPAAAGSLFAPYDANPNALGFFGFSTGMSLVWPLGGFEMTNEGRAAITILDDYNLWYNDQAAWFAQRPNGINILLMDRYDTGGAMNGNPTQLHTAGVNQTVLYDISDSQPERVPAQRFGNGQEIQALVGLYGTKQAGLATDSTAWQLMTLYDIDDPASAGHAENWGDFDVSPQIHTEPEFLDGQFRGAGSESISESSTLAIDFHSTENRLYVLDGVDNSIEVFQSLPDPDINAPIGFGSFAIESQPGTMVNRLT